MSHFSPIVLALLMSTVFILIVNGQSNNACTGAMMRSFNPCISFLSGGANGSSSSPTTGCCNSLRDLMSNSQNCLCLMVTGGIPFQVPINQTLAISLPRACKMSGVPIECKGSGGSPIPAPAPGSSGQDRPMSPGLSPPSPTSVPFLPQPLTPPSIGGLTPPPPQMPGGDVVPTFTPPGMRPTLNPSASNKPYAWPCPSIFVAFSGVLLIMNCIY